MRENDVPHPEETIDLHNAAKVIDELLVIRQSFLVEELAEVP